MDKYPIEAAGSRIENNPMYRVIFKSPIDPIKLEDSINKALDYFPLFKSKVLFDKEYYLETNNKPLVIRNIDEDNRPKTFGRNTNDYPWAICYFENKLTFEWLHGVSDGVGALKFLSHILLEYFEVDKKPTDKYLVGPGLEPFFDSNEKGIDFRADPEGFSFKEFKKIKNRGYKTDSHELRCDTQEILNLAKTTGSSIAPIITILFSQALRKHLPQTMKNRDVACNVVLDLRRPLNYETMHNCVEYKRITYTDKYDDMSFTSVAKEYKAILDNARLLPNVVRIITERVKDFELCHMFKNKFIIKTLFKIVGLLLKDKDCNFVVTYPGKIVLPGKVKNKIENIDFKVWHDFGECIIACVDYNGKFNLNISENYMEKGVVEDFIELSSKLGIHWQYLKTSVFEQAHFEE